MRLRRTLAVLVLAALTSLSPALAQTPARAERTAPPGLVDLLLHQLARIQAKVLGDTTGAGSRPDPSGSRSDTGSGIDPDGAK